MFKLSLLISISIMVSIQQIVCEEESSEFKAKLLADYNVLNHDLAQRLLELNQDDSSNEESNEVLRAEKRFPRWGGGVKSLHDLKYNRFGNYEQAQNEKRFPKWRNSELKSRLNSPQKFEPYFGDSSSPLRKIWEKNFLEKNKIYEKNNLI